MVKLRRGTRESYQEELRRENSPTGEGVGDRQGRTSDRGGTRGKPSDANFRQRSGVGSRRGSAESGAYEGRQHRSNGSELPRRQSLKNRPFTGRKERLDQGGQSSRVGGGSSRDSSPRFGSEGGRTNQVNRRGSVNGGLRAGGKEPRNFRETRGSTRNTRNNRAVGRDSRAARVGGPQRDGSHGYGGDRHSREDYAASGKELATPLGARRRGKPDSDRVRRQEVNHQRRNRKDGDPVRLQKFLAECGVASRRASEGLIVEGRVKVNGQVVTELGTKINPVKDRVQVGKRIVVAAEKGILLFHKPRFVVSTLSDPEGRPSISDYLTKHYLSYFPVGRLDWESSGLIVLTNDGELAERLMHPRYEMDRFYEVRVEGRVPDRTLEKLLNKVKLEDGWAKAESLRILSIDDSSTWLEISIREGRNRLIRRMMSEVGHAVIKLRRISHGPFKLGKLKSGELRKLTSEEYLNVRRKVFERQGHY